jgi:hypothetical protein
VTVDRAALTAAEPASAMTACRRVLGPVDVDIADFPDPGLRRPVQPGRYAVWRYDGTQPVPAVPAPSAAAIELLHQVSGEPWPSPLSGYVQAAPLGELPLDDLLGLLAYLPGRRRRMCRGNATMVPAQELAVHARLSTCAAVALTRKVTVGEPDIAQASRSFRCQLQVSALRLG